MPGLIPDHLINETAEQQLVAAVIQRGSRAYDYASHVLQGMDPFNRPHRRQLWRLFEEMASKGEMGDAIAGDQLVEWMRKTPASCGESRDDDIGSDFRGPSLFEKDNVKVLDDASAYAPEHTYPKTLETLRHLSIGRFAVSQMDRALKRSANRSNSPIDELGHAWAHVEQTVRSRATAGLLTMADAEESRIQRELAEAGEGSIALTWGIEDMDDKVPLRGGRMYVLAGRPSEGKTTFALQAQAANLKHGIPMGFISLESRAEDLAEMIQPHCLDIEHLKMWHLSKSAKMTVKDLSVEFRRLQREGCRMIAVDYLQLLRSSSQRASEYERVTEASQELMALANESGICVLAIAQMNRLVDVASDQEMPRPKLSDLRGSGAIEQDADAVIFCWRRDDKSKAVVTTTMLVEKQRRGGLGGVDVRFNKLKGIFEPLIAKGPGRHEQWEKKPSDKEDLFDV